METAVKWPAEERREHGGWKKVSSEDPDVGLSTSCVGDTKRPIGSEQRMYVREAPCTKQGCVPGSLMVGGSQGPKWGALGHSGPGAVSGRPSNILKRAEAGDS